MTRTLSASTMSSSSAHLARVSPCHSMPSSLAAWLALLGFNQLLPEVLRTAGVFWEDEVAVVTMHPTASALDLPRDWVMERGNQLTLAF